MKLIELRVEIHRASLPSRKISLAQAQRTSSALDLIFVQIKTDAGIEGIGLTQAPGIASAAIKELLTTDFAAMLEGEDILAHERLFMKAQTRTRGLGWEGLVARAYAAIDLAIWDLKGKQANLPLWRLLGGMRASAPVYRSDVACLGEESSTAIRTAKPQVASGMLGVLVEVGSEDIQEDADRIRDLRSGLGEGAWLGVTAQGRYDLNSALAIGEFLAEEVEIDWFEDPLPLQDESGYRRLSNAIIVPIAWGSGISDIRQFRHVLEEGAIRVLRPDPLRLGGITPLLKLASLAEQYPVIVAPYRLPEVNVHLACGLRNIQAVEYVSWANSALENPLPIEGGVLTPRNEPGLGIKIKQS